MKQLIKNNADATAQRKHTGRLFIKYNWSGLYRLNRVPIRTILLAWLVLFVWCQGKAQTVPHLSTGSYNNETEIKATGSVTLTDGFYVPIGKSVRIFTGMSFAECVNLVSSPSANQNYVRTRIFKEPGVTEANLDAVRSACNVNETILYADGLGRTSQIVRVQGSPTFKDVIQPIAYDAFGREDKKYLPFPASGSNGTYRTDALTAQNNFYTAPTPGIPSMPGAAFSQTKFEASPLNRVEQQGAPGASWQLSSGHTAKMVYSTNGVNEVKLWKIGASGASTNEYYQPGTLHKTTLMDENWVSGKTGTIEEFVDLENHLVLKRQWETETKSLATYYLYNDLGMLCYVLPPAVSENTDRLPTALNSFLEADAVFDQFIYGYHYDGRKRIIEKKIPGKGWESIIYNKVDQAVLTQDAKLRSNNQWLYTKYDALGRAVMTGLYTDAATRLNLQTTVDGQAVLWESRAEGADYSNLAFPQSGIELLTVSYYDNYNFPGNNFGSPTGDQAPPARVNSLLTATKTKVLGSQTMLLNVFYYDLKGQIVQSKNENHLGGTDIVDNTYNFSGDLVATNRSHKVNNITTTVATRHEYDHMGRKKATMESINGGTEVAINKLDYNEVGQLIKKSVHSTDGQNFLQFTNFAYNERGWLKSSSADQFNLELKYQDGTLPQYNGNISSQEYNNGGTNTFNYSYDPLNRLSAATAGKGLGESLTYDIMGNIKTLSRDGFGTNSYTGYNGNRLTAISGFINGSYVHDVNGNVINDGPRNVTISYNHLNLPEQVSGSQNITYTYDATGKKLKKQSASTGTTNYVNGIHYKTDGTIDFIQTEEGVARSNGGLFSYEYNLTDHLGNVRATFYKNPTTGQIEILQRDDYFAFGKQRVVNAGTNKYLYNGKELQQELGQLDYGARFYDPEIGRFNTIDRFAEKYYTLTSYQYGGNNPISTIDVNGDSLWVTNRTGFMGLGKKETLRYENGKYYNKDGSEYGGKVNGFLKATASALDKLSQTEEGNSLISSLVGSENNFTIEEGAKNKFDPTSPRRAAANLEEYQTVTGDMSGSKGSGGTIFFNPSITTSSLNTAGNLDRPVFLGLGHEMAHARDSNFGILHYMEDYKGPNGYTYKFEHMGLSKAEWRAAYYENIIRGQAGVPLRTYYGLGVDGNTGANNGLGPRLLDVNNRPINYYR